MILLFLAFKSVTFVKIGLTLGYFSIISRYTIENLSKKVKIVFFLSNIVLYAFKRHLENYD